MTGMLNKIKSKLMGKIKNNDPVAKGLAFDEAAYLSAYPDVAAAVKGGVFTSGQAHYDLNGYSEGRVALVTKSLGTRWAELKSVRVVNETAAANSILDAYVKTLPTDQNVIDLFKGEWSSTMPAESGLKSEPGRAGLFEDGRITWANKMLGGFEGKNVLELGPLEGAHSYMLQKMGASTITSVESNQRAFMKCLCVKEIFNLNRVHFKLGSFIPFLETTNEKFDAAIASGVLYHMTDPVSVLTKMARVSDKLFLWTHYYEKNYCTKNKQIFDAPHSYKLAGFEGVGAKRYYRESLNWRGFCGGSETHAVWLSKETILKHLGSLGFNKIDIHIDDLNHPNGPAFSFSAQRI